MKESAVAYVAPFAVFLLFIGVKGMLPFGAEVEYPLRFIVVGGVVLWLSRGVLDLKPSVPLQSILVGIAVFAIWIGPDLFSREYRTHWIFQNALTGTLPESAPESLKTNPVFLIFRVAGTALLVPIIEELFWRGWLMRYLIRPRFQEVELGTFSIQSFILTALLFATEHGPYWEVGLAAGIIYNAWMIRTRKLADCMLAHGVTNAMLAAYVLLTDNWQYWL